MTQHVNTVILDFDGTVADSFAMAVDIAQTLLKTYGYPVWTKEQIMEMRELSAAQLLKFVKVSPRHLPAMVRYIRKEQKTRIDTVQPVEGIEDVLKELKKHYTLAIVSSSEASLIEGFLAKHKLNGYIDDVIGSAPVFQKHRPIRKYIKQREIGAEHALYIGDEVRDVDAAHRAKIPIISVTWGFNGHKALRKAQPSAIAEEPSQLIPEIAKLLPVQPGE